MGDVEQIAKLTFGQVPRHGLHQRSEAGRSSRVKEFGVVRMRAATCDSDLVILECRPRLVIQSRNLE